MMKRKQTNGIDNINDRILDEMKSACGTLNGIRFQIELEEFDSYQMIGTRESDGEAVSARFGIGDAVDLIEDYNLDVAASLQSVIVDQLSRIPEDED